MSFATITVDTDRIVEWNVEVHKDIYHRTQDTGLQQTADSRHTAKYEIPKYPV